MGCGKKEGDGMTINTIQVASVSIALLAILASLLLYMRRPRFRSREMQFIGLLNVIIGFALLVVITTSIIAPSHNSGSKFVPLGTLITGFFIIGQVFYLLQANFSIRRRRYPTFSTNEQPPLQPIKNNDDLHEKLQECLRNANSIKMIQIFDMGHRVNLDDIYVPIKVFPEQTLEQDYIEVVEVMAGEEIKESPEHLLSREQDNLTNRIERAKDPIEVLVRESWKHCVLIGEPGIGKTTFLHHLALQVAQNKIPSFIGVTPIYVELNDFLISPEKDLFNFIIYYYKKTYQFNASMRDFLVERCQQGKILLLLDAIDETLGGETPTQSRIYYDTVRTAIEKLASDYENARILVTSRKATYALKGTFKVKGLPFKTLEMPGFFTEQKRAFVTAMQNKYPQYYSNRSEKNTPDAFIVSLQENQRLSNLSRSPLLLMFMTLAYIRGFSVSNSRADIIGDCANILLARWNASKGLVKDKNEIYGTERFSEFSSDEKYGLLKHLAWSFHDRRWKVFPNSDVLKETMKFLSEQKRFLLRQELVAKKILEEITTETGLLYNVSSEAYSFSHHTFQEYFAAQFAAEATDAHYRECQKELSQHQGDSWWEEVILLYVSYTEISSILNALLSPERCDIFCTNYLLAGRYIASTPPNTSVGSSRIMEVIDYLFKTFEKTSHADLREQIAFILAEIGLKFIDDQLIDIVKNKDKPYPLHMRKLVIEALVSWGNEQVLEKFKEILKEHVRTDFDVQQSIIRTLAQRSNVALARELIPLLTSSMDLTLRQELAATLGLLGKSYGKGESSIASSLLNAFFDLTPEKDISIELRQKIVRSLAQLGDPAIIPELLKLLSSRTLDDNEKVEIIQTLRELVPLSEQDQKDTILTFVNNLAQAPAGEQLAQGYIIALGNWLKSVTLKNEVLEQVSYLEKLASQKENLWLEKRCQLLIIFFGEQFSEKASEEASEELKKQLQAKIDTLLPKDRPIDKELIPFISSLNISLLPDDKYATLFFEHLAHFIFMSQSKDSLYKELIELLGNVANLEIVKEVLSFLSNVSNAEIYNGKLLHIIIKEVQKIYDSGKFSTSDAAQALITLLKNLSRRDADGYLILDVVEAIITIARPEREAAIAILSKSEHRPKAFTGTGIYYALALGLLADETVLESLLSFLYKQTTDGRIRKIIIRIIDRLSSWDGKISQEQWSGIAQQLEQQLKLSTLTNEIRSDLVEALKCIACNVNDTNKMSQQICETLVTYISVPGISDTVYKAVEQISMRKDLRVFYLNEDEGEIRVEPRQPITTSALA